MSMPQTERPLSPPKARDPLVGQSAGAVTSRPPLALVEKQPYESRNNEAGLPTVSTMRSFLSITPPHTSDPESRAPSRHSRGGQIHPDHSPHSTVRARKTPIFSGLLAPFSIVLEVPGLTSKWYAKIDEDGLVIRFIDNPVVLTVFLAISLGAACIANLAIVGRFLEVLPPRVSIALAIAGFALHDLINVVALATFGGIYGPKNDGLSLSAAYWMVCASTIVSVLVTASLIVDYLRTSDFRHAGSGLTQLQKGLVLASMALLIYLSLGSLIFVFLIDIDFITALYFSCATVLTVGFGDVVPPSAGGKIMVIVYAPVGIVLVAMVVSSARNTILETFQESLMQRREEHKTKSAQRKAAHTDYKRQDRALRRKLTRAFTSGPGTSSANGANDFGDALVQMEKNALDDTLKDSPTISLNSEKGDGLTLATASNEKGNRVGMVDVGRTGDPDLQVEIAALQHSLLMEKEKTEEDFRQFEKHAAFEARYAARIKILLAASITMTFWLLGAMAFKFAERWSYGGAMWFCFIAMITIGYGDYHPATQLGRAIFVIWGLLGVAVLTILLAVVQDAFGSVFNRLLVGSTARLFDRAETRARKRRHKKHVRRSSVASATNVNPTHNRAGRQTARSHMKARKKHEIKALDFAPIPTIEGNEKETVTDGRVCDSPEPDTQHDVQSSGSHGTADPPTDAAPSSSLFSERQEQLLDYSQRSNIGTLASGRAMTFAPGTFVRRRITGGEEPCKMESTLVSQPQKLAHAALITYQHSVQVLKLHEMAIMKTMVEVPALRKFYNARQRTNSMSQPNADKLGTSAEEAETMEDAALQQLYTGIRHTGNQEHENIARLVVANLEFETSLRKLLNEISGLKSQVEQELIVPAFSSPSDNSSLSEQNPSTRLRRISL